MWTIESETNKNGSNTEKISNIYQQPSSTMNVDTRLISIELNTFGLNCVDIYSSLNIDFELGMNKYINNQF